MTETISTKTKLKCELPNVTFTLTDYKKSPRLISFWETVMPG